MKTINKILFFISISVFAISCDDVFEEDITDANVHIIAPLDNSTIESNVVTFRWNSISGAKKYRIQVYSGNQSMVLDTLVGSTNFTFPIVGGFYDWRIRAENSAYQSSYNFPVGFQVIESNNLNNQQMILNNPSGGSYFNHTSVTCSWQQLSAADSYDFELYNHQNGQSYYSNAMANTMLAIPAGELAQDSKYTWKVRAKNAFSATAFSSRDFWIDRVNPNPPTLAAPLNNSNNNIGQEIDFSWTMPGDSGNVQSPIVSYTIEISRESTFVTYQSSSATSVGFEQSFTDTGAYFWRVKAVDAANNTGSYSSVFKYTIN